MSRILRFFLPTVTLGLLSSSLAASLEYPLPYPLSKLSNYKLFNGPKKQDTGLNNSKAQREVLSKNGFVVTPAKFKQFYELYEDGRYGDVPTYVTTDSVLHIYHLIFDKMLRDLERQKFAPNLQKMNARLAAAAEKQYLEAKGTPLEGASQKVWAYLAVAQKLADPKSKIPAALEGMVKKELALIDNHAGISDSSLFGFKEDYSQYIPRGHYTRSEALKNYFRSMIWYGRINFRLKEDEETRMALLLSRIINQNPDIQKMWTDLYEPTAFIVGKSDDLNFSQYGSIMANIYPKNTLADLADNAKLEQFRTAAAALPDPKINSVVLNLKTDLDKTASSKGFRLMGQRFVLDAFVMENLVFRKVGTEAKPRMLPSGLDVFAALGSTAAYDILKARGDTAFANYDPQMTKLKTALGQLGPADWNDTLYNGWLYTLKALTNPRGKGYPTYMQTAVWAKKDLNTALGSWTELKHDTILYAKQVMAEMGSGEPEVIPQGYVEPIVEVYARLNNLAQKTKVGLKARGLLLEKTTESLDALIDMAGFLQRAAKTELSGKPLSKDDYERIYYYGGWLEEQTFAAMDTDGEGGTPSFSEDQQAALVADIATDPNGSALEVGTGRIFEILAIVPGNKGIPRVVRGGVYSHYEFTVPLANRLTDDAWHKMLDSGKAPKQPEWMNSFIVK